MIQDSTRLSKDFHAENALGSLSQIREFLRSCCEESIKEKTHTALFNSQVAELELAVTELISNIIRHGFHGLPQKRLHLRCNISDEGELELTLTHHGRPFHPDTNNVPDVTEPMEGGMGLYLIAECVDEVKYSTLADGTNQVQLTKTLTFFQEGK